MIVPDGRAADPCWMATWLRTPAGKGTVAYALRHRNASLLADSVMRPTPPHDASVQEECRHAAGRLKATWESYLHELDQFRTARMILGAGLEPSSVIDARMEEAYQMIRDGKTGRAGEDGQNITDAVRNGE